jgi:hypothetical protein
MTQTRKPTISTNRIYQRFLKQGYQETVKWYAEAKQTDFDDAAYHVSFKLVDSNDANVQEALDIGVCRGLWRKYMNDADVAVIAREVLTLPADQRHDTIFWKLVKYHIPSHADFLILETFYIVFPEIRKTEPWKELGWVDERLQVEVREDESGIIVDSDTPETLTDITCHRGTVEDTQMPDMNIKQSNNQENAGILSTLGYGIIAFICCVIACFICNGWDTLKMDKPDSLFPNPSLRWVVSSITVIILWFIIMTGADVWIEKVKRNPLYLLMMIPILLMSAVIIGYIANIVAALLVMLIGLIITLFIAIFVMFT